MQKKYHKILSEIREKIKNFNLSLKIKKIDYFKSCFFINFNFWEKILLLAYCGFWPDK